MDPTTTLIEFLEACKDKNHIVAANSLEYLSDWINKGGHLPKVDTITRSLYRAEITIQKEKFKRRIR